jgi:hypothetical protein
MVLGSVVRAAALGKPLVNVTRSGQAGKAKKGARGIPAEFAVAPRATVSLAQPHRIV